MTLPPATHAKVLELAGLSPGGALPDGIGERAFQDEVVRLARMLDWRVAYFRPARVLRRGVEKYETAVGADGKGYPDLMLLHPDGRQIVCELKSATGRVSVAQRGWLDAFAACGVAAYVWRPGDFSEIQRVLGRADR